jgi:hypothetical protein
MLLAIQLQDMQWAVFFVFFIAIAWLLAEFKGMKDEIRERTGINNETMKLQMQAYERLTLFAERISLKSLVTRIPYGNQSVLDYQLALLGTIGSEYEYNVSQQVYVSADMWKAIGNLKDQHSFIINQIAATLPGNAPAVELAKRILEYNGAGTPDLSAMVREALQFDARKILDRPIGNPDRTRS